MPARTTSQDEHQRLTALIDLGDPAAAAEFLHEIPPAEAVRALSLLDDEHRSRLLALLDPDDATDMLEHLPEPQAVKAIEDLEPASAARIIEELPSDEQADILGQLEEADAEAILGELAPQEAEDIRRLAEYPESVAGGLMVTEYLSYPSDRSVAQVIEDLGANAEEYADYDIQYAYVTENEGRLVGVLRMRDLLLAPRHARIGTLMIPDPHAVEDMTPLSDLVVVFDEHRFFGMPVVGSDRSLRGVIHRAAVEEAVAEDSESVYRRSQGIIGGEELRSMPVLVRSRRRLSWLSVNILLNIVAASVIAMHQDTLEAVIALAVFLPIISDMSGCSGNQAVAVSMRELTLGVVRPQDVGRVLLGEVRVGAINGLALGILIGLVAFLWKGNPYLGIVVGSALTLNTVVAVAIGGCVPLILRRLKKDPALAAGPILTTVTDMCGFFLVLTFASMAMPLLR